MKSRFFTIFFIATCLPFFFSCEKAGNVETAEVSLTLNIPASVATKAVSDGAKANIVYWAAFDESGNPIAGLNGSANVTSKSAVINPTLVLHVPYKFVFWAHKGGTDGKNPSYNLDEFVSKGKVTVSYSGPANDEDRDAFYTHEVITIDQRAESRNRTIKLYRPFAQINFLAKDYAAVEAAGVDVGLTSKVEISNLPSVLNGLDGSVSGTASTSLTHAAVLSGDDKYFTVNNVKCGWYSMNYVLAGARNDNLTVVGKFKHTKSANEIVVTVNSVPYERNYRTNIIGDFMTEQAMLTVTIDPAFVDADNDGKPDDINDGYIIQ